MYVAPAGLGMELACKSDLLCVCACVRVCVHTHKQTCEYIIFTGLFGCERVHF